MGSNFDVCSAPPRVGPSPFAAKKTNFMGTHTPSGTVGKLGGLVPPGGAATLRSTPKDSAKCGATMSCTTASQKTATPQPSLAGQSLDKKDALPELHRTPGGTALHFSVNPITDPGSADHTLCHGKCAVKLPQAAEDITANFVLKIEKPTNRALLVLSAPGKPQRVHNIVDLKQPVIQNNYCLVASVPGRANVAYLLRLQTAELTAKFKLYLESLQVTMKRQQKSTLPLPKRTGDGTATGSGVRNNGEASSQSSRSAMPAHGPSTPVSTAPLTTVASQGPSGSSAAPMLVDLDDSDESRDPANPYATIEDAADKLCTLMDSLERDFVDKGFPLTGDAVDELQDTAIDIWLQRGFLGAEDADIKEDMIKLLKSLFQVKRQAMQFRHKFKTSRVLRSSSTQVAESSSIKSLQELQLGPAPRGRIQYTSEQISQLAAKATSRPKDLDRAEYLPPPGTKRIKLSPAPKIDGLSQVRRWLNNGERQAPAGPRPLASSSIPVSNVPVPATMPAMPVTATPGAVKTSSATSCEAMELGRLQPALTKRGQQTDEDFTDSLPPTPALRQAAPAFQGTTGGISTANTSTVSVLEAKKGTELATKNAAAQPPAPKPVAKGLANSRWAN